MGKALVRLTGCPKACKRPFAPIGFQQPCKVYRNRVFAWLDNLAFTHVELDFALYSEHTPENRFHSVFQNIPHLMMHNEAVMHRRAGLSADQFSKGVKRA